VEAIPARESPGETVGEVSAGPYRRTLRACGGLSAQARGADSEMDAARVHSARSYTVHSCNSTPAPLPRRLPLRRAESRAFGVTARAGGRPPLRWAPGAAVRFFLRFRARCLPRRQRVRVMRYPGPPRRVRVAADKSPAKDGGPREIS